MTFPRASRRRVTGITTTATANTSNKLGAQGFQGAFKVGEGIGAPLGTIGSGNSAIPGKGNVQYIVNIVGLVAIDGIAVAGPAEGIGDLSNQRRAVVAVRVTPNTIELTSTLAT